LVGQDSWRQREGCASLPKGRLRTPSSKPKPGWVFRRRARFAEDGSSFSVMAVSDRTPQRASADNSRQSVGRPGETDQRLTGTQMSHPPMRIGSSSSVPILLMCLDTCQIQSRPSGAGLRSSMPALPFSHALISTSRVPRACGRDEADRRPADTSTSHRATGSCSFASALNQATIHAVSYRHRDIRLGYVAGAWSFGSGCSRPGRRAHHRMAEPGRSLPHTPPSRLFHLQSARESAVLARACRSQRGERDASFAASSWRA
jgi:hypothetical protein